MSDSRTLLRIVSFVEGITFVGLMGIAMPLKYLSDPQWPLPVKIAGPIHGGFVILLIALLFWVVPKYGWKMSRAVVVFVAMLIPFGPFFIDRRLAAWSKEPTES